MTAADGTPALARSTAQCLALHAMERPAATAIVDRDRRTTYHELATQVLAAMADITTAGIRRGQVAGVAVADRHSHLLVLLAAEALGVTTVSLQPGELAAASAVVRLCDRMIVQEPVAWLDLGKQLVLKPDAPARPAAHPLDELQREQQPGFVARLIRSSGTTGAPKVMRMTQAVQQRILQKVFCHPAPRTAAHLDYLCLYGFTVRAAHSRALLTLQLGGTIHFTGADGIGGMIAAGTGNYALFTAGDLERFVGSAPPGRKRADLHLDVIGSSVPARLRQRIREAVTDHLLVTYSCNEVNRVSAVGDDNVGTLFPDARVRIVDDGGQTLPPGQQGRIRLKTGTMTDGYVDAPEATRAAFVDGWFHTSDVGFQPSPDTLVVLGRADDMLNIGGIKFAPGPMEARLRATTGIRDALVTSFDGQMDTGVVLAAVETVPGVDANQLAHQITSLIRPHFRHFHILVLPELPRTETGKIARQAVKDLFRGHAERS